VEGSPDVGHRDEREARQSQLRETLGALGRKHGSFWLVLTLLLLLADRVYHPPARFTASFLSGLLIWAFLFVALPVYSTASSMARLCLGSGDPIPDDLRFHRLLAAANLAVIACCAAAVWAGWPFLLLAVLSPLLTLLTCRALAFEGD
jgi:hypothetical protein